MALLVEAATLLMVGMSVVFMFLAMLIGAVKGIAWFCAKYPPDQEVASGTLSINSPPTENKIPLPVIAAISAAIAQYRSKH